MSEQLDLLIEIHQGPSTTPWRCAQAMIGHWQRPQKAWMTEDAANASRRPFLSPCKTRQRSARPPIGWRSRRSHSPACAAVAGGQSESPRRLFQLLANEAPPVWRRGSPT
jgi:hypothetical protein